MISSELPEIVWFKPTQNHIDNPAQHLMTSVPEAKTAVSNLWYSAHGARSEERVLIMNWKSNESRTMFMESPAYISWGMPLLDITSTAAILGQYRLLSPSPELVKSIFNATATEFFYFESETFNDSIREYLGSLQGAMSCVGGVWGECVEDFNSYKRLLVVGWAGPYPIHDDHHAEGLYRYLVANSSKRWIRNLTYIPI